MMGLLKNKVVIFLLVLAVVTGVLYLSGKKGKSHETDAILELQQIFSNANVQQVNLKNDGGDVLLTLSKEKRSDVVVLTPRKKSKVQKEDKPAASQAKAEKSQVSETQTAQDSMPDAPPVEEMGEIPEGLSDSEGVPVDEAQERLIRNLKKSGYSDEQIQDVINSSKVSLPAPAARPKPAPPKEIEVEEKEVGPMDDRLEQYKKERQAQKEAAEDKKGMEDDIRTFKKLGLSIKNLYVAYFEELKFQLLKPTVIFQEQFPELSEKIDLERRKFDRRMKHKIKPEDIRKWALAIIIPAYILYCIPFIIIAKKFSIRRFWLGGVPIAQEFVLCKMAGVTSLFLILYLIPFVQFLAIIFLWWRVAGELSKNTWASLFMIIPGLNILTIWYFSQG